MRYHSAVCWIMFAVLSVTSAGNELYAQGPLPMQIPPNLFNAIQGRGAGEVPLNEVFGTNFQNAIGVDVDGVHIYRRAVGCGVAPDGKCTIERERFTSADRRPAATAAICKSLGAQSLYVLVREATSNGDRYYFYIADVCGNPLDPPDPRDKDQQRVLLNWMGSDESTYSAVQYADPAPGDVYRTNVVRVVHPSIYAARLGSNNTTLYQLVGQTGATYVGAGTISVEDGRVLSIDNCSGHFKPPDAYLTFAGMILNGLGVWILNNPLYSILRASPPTTGATAEAGCKSLDRNQLVWNPTSVPLKSRDGSP